ncbi:MAG TPA: BON domain-containing protein [Burkholderiales bacterium]|nr:BON domain-containing protein [Burkholderiales bacterium]
MVATATMRAPLLISLLLASAPALAQPAGFPALDRNGDGYLSRVEALADQEIYKRFAQFDANGDRQLSATEYLAAREDNQRRARHDAALTARVKAALSTERGIRAGAIAVETYEGRVQLSGFVPLPDMASRAGRVTAGVNGVRSVHNNITVK